MPARLWIFIAFGLCGLLASCSDDSDDCEDAEHEEECEDDSWLLDLLLEGLEDEDKPPSGPPLVNSGKSALWSTEEGLLTHGSGRVRVIVRDACTRKPLPATVWIDDGDQHQQTGSDVTFEGVAGDPSPRTVSAGAPGYSLASIRTSATEVRLALLPVDTTAGRVPLPIIVEPASPDLEAWALGHDGSLDQLALPASGRGQLEVVPARLRSVLAVRRETGTITAAAVWKASASGPPDSLRLQLATVGTATDGGLGSLSGIAAGHDTGQARSVLRGRCFALELSPPVAFLPSSLIDGFRQLDPGVYEELTRLGGYARLELETRDSASGEETFLYQPHLPGTPLPHLALPWGYVHIDQLEQGTTRPRLDFASSIQRSSGFFEVRLEAREGPHRTRLWTLYLDGDARFLQLPAKPAALADEGLVAGQVYELVLSACSAPVLDFDKLDLSFFLDNPAQSGWRDRAVLQP